MFDPGRLSKLSPLEMRARIFLYLRHPESNTDEAIQALVKNLLDQFIAQVRVFTILGKAGCGKGTLSAWLIDELNKSLPQGSRYETLVLGGYFRKILKIRKGGNDIDPQDLEVYGPLASFVTDQDLADMKAGKMISDQTVVNVVTAILKSEPFNSAFGLFFDGFPRNMEQVHILNSHKITWQGKPLSFDLYVHSHIPKSRDSVFKKRAKMRIAQEMARAALEQRPPEIREDDRPEVIEERLVTFYRQTQPAIKHILKHDDVRSFQLSGTTSGQIQDSIVMDRAKLLTGWLLKLKSSGR